jgi:hypothetical protein
VNIPVRTASKPKFLKEEMLATARAHAAHLENELNLRGSAVMLRLLVADIEAYREAFKGSVIVVKQAGDMLKRQESDAREASRSLALTQLKLSVLFEAAKEVLPFLDRKIAECRLDEGIEGHAAMIAVADGLRAAIEVAGD